MSDLNIPEELRAFLAAGQQLDYDPATAEPGAVGLKSLDELELGVVWIDTQESPLAGDDPESGSEGYYEVPAVSLTGTCEDYDPEFILLWLPEERAFGTWDCDHWDLYVFRDTTWPDIVAAPARYLNAQWADYERKLSEYFKPFPRYPFKPGRPF